MADQVRPKPSYNPIAWGTLFFTFWLTLITIPKANMGQIVIAWIFFSLSCLLFLAIFIPPLDKPLSQPIVQQSILPTVFIISIFVWVIGSLTVLPNVPKPYQIIVAAGTLLWMIAYLTITVWSIKQKKTATWLGIGTSVVVIALGITDLFHKVLQAEPWVTIIIGIVLLLITLSKSKIGREFPLV